VTANQDDSIIKALLERQADIAEAEDDLRRSRRLFRGIATGSTVAPVVFVGLCIATAFLWSSVDLEPYWQAGGLVIVAAAALAIIFGVRLYGESDLWNPRELALNVEQAHQAYALYASGARVALSIRQYSYRGAIQRSVESIRRRGARYRTVHNIFQSLIIIGSLATTTVASLSPDTGPLKWTAVGLSFTVGLAAGFTGYFKYRERAFYLRQTADDLEEQLNAYELGLSPFDTGAEDERIARLTARTEAIRVAQQRREQQLDQPKSPSEGLN
jgi:hypothetical protein